MTSNEIGKGLKVKYKNINYALDKLVERGLIVRNNYSENNFIDAYDIK